MIIYKHRNVYYLHFGILYIRYNKISAPSPGKDLDKHPAVVGTVKLVLREVILTDKF